MVLMCAQILFKGFLVNDMLLLMSAMGTFHGSVPPNKFPAETFRAIPTSLVYQEIA